MSGHNEEHITAEETKHDKAHKSGGGWGFLILGIALGAIVGWVLWPNVVMSSKDQPLNFSHKAHIEGGGMTCDGCHVFREDGSFAGIPKLDKCVECHESAQGSNPEEAKLISDYIGPKKEIPWRSYSFQPGCVFFSHAAHVNMAKLDCKTCHEKDMAASTSSPAVRVYILSGYSEGTMTMEECEDCHAKKHTSNACFVCHK